MTMFLVVVSRMRQRWMHCRGVLRKVCFLRTSLWWLDNIINGFDIMAVRVGLLCYEVVRMEIIRALLTKNMFAAMSMW